MVSIEEKVRFLSEPDNYPGRPAMLQVRETHMSWVFLVGERAYKLKKPVRHPFLDYRSIEAREGSCRAEIELNRCLAPGVYLGAVPLAVDENGKLALEPARSGEVVDWLVKMKRLPGERMLDIAIARGTVDDRLLRRAAERLVRFYREAKPEPVGADRYREGLAAAVADHADGLLHPGYGICPARIGQIRGALLETLDWGAWWFAERASGGRILDGHGDLRPEHVCLLDDPVIIDRLDFERGLRILDPLEEIAFLSVECEILGSGGIGRVFLGCWREAFGDRLPDFAVPFFKAKRCLLRAKLAMAHTLEEQYRGDPKWRRRTEAYLGAGERHARTARTAASH